MWDKKRRGQENTAALAVKPPANTTIHNYAIGFSWPIAVGFVCLIFAVIFGWNGLVFLFDRAGAKRPEEAASQTLLGLLIALPTLYLAAQFGSKIIRNLALVIMDAWFQGQREIYELRIQLEETKALVAGSPSSDNNRLTEEQKRFRENLLCVMQRAYNDLRQGQYTQGQPRPWSREQVLNNPAPRWGKMPFNKAPEIRRWLVEKNVIAGNPGNDQVNTKQFPTFSEFVVLIEGEWSLPVRIGNGQDLRDNQGFVFTD